MVAANRDYHHFAKKYQSPGNYYALQHTYRQFGHSQLVFHPDVVTIPTMFS